MAGGTYSGGHIHLARADIRQLHMRILTYPRTSPLALLRRNQTDRSVAAHLNAKTLVSFQHSSHHRAADTVRPKAAVTTGNVSCLWRSSSTKAVVRTANVRTFPFNAVPRGNGLLITHLEASLSF